MTKQERIKNITNNNHSHENDSDFIDCCAIGDKVDIDLVNAHPVIEKMKEDILHNIINNYKNLVKEELFNRIREVTLSHDWEVYFIYKDMFYTKCSKCNNLRRYVTVPIDQDIKYIRDVGEEGVFKFFHRILTCEETIISDIIK